MPVDAGWETGWTEVALGYSVEKRTDIRLLGLAQLKIEGAPTVFDDFHIKKYLDRACCGTGTPAAGPNGFLLT